jgi:hypothetical protein
MSGIAGNKGVCGSHRVAVADAKLGFPPAPFFAGTELIGNVRYVLESNDFRAVGIAGGLFVFLVLSMQKQSIDLGLPRIRINGLGLFCALALEFEGDRLVGPLRTTMLNLSRPICPETSPR